MKYKNKIAMAVVSIVMFVLMFMYLMGSLSGQEKIAPGKLPEQKIIADRNKTTFVVKAVEREITTEAVGSIQSGDKTSISSKIMASILEMKVKSGNNVKKGDLLVVVDDRDIKAKLEQAKEGLNAAKASLTNAEAELERYKKLYDQKVASKHEYENMVTQYKVAVANVKGAEEAVKEGEVTMSYAQIKAPVSGVVIDKIADVGDLAMPGRPLLNIYNQKLLQLEVSIREQLKSRIKLEDKMKVHIDSLGKDIEGTVVEIVPSADISSRSFTVKISLPECTECYQGMFGRLYIPLGKKKVLLIPKEAIMRVGQLEMVKVIKEGLVSKRAIKTGKTYDGMAEVLSGLKENEEIMLLNK